MREYRPGGIQGLPPVVKNLLIINVIVFLIQNLAQQRGFPIEDMFALHFWSSPKFRWWQMITHMFMHGSLMHIFTNMFALWMFGHILEGVWGSQRFLIFYIVCGIGAALCHLGVLAFEFNLFFDRFAQYQQNPGYQQFVNFMAKENLKINPAALQQWSTDPQSPVHIQDSINFLNSYSLRMINEATVGASGAVFGLLFAFGYLFPNTLLYLYFAIPVKAKWFVAGYAAIELFSGVRNSAGDNVAHFAHLGGMLFAFILLRIWKNRVRNRFY